jgi:hypothetical protein
VLAPIKDHLAQLLMEVQQLDYVVIVGGFGESELLHDAVKSVLPPT